MVASILTGSKAEKYIIQRICKDTRTGCFQLCNDLISCTCCGGGIIMPVIAGVVTVTVGVVVLVVVVTCHAVGIGSVSYRSRGSNDCMRSRSRSGVDYHGEHYKSILFEYR